MILESPKPPANAAAEAKRLSKAVMGLVFNHPFYAFLIMRLARVASKQYPAFASDGITLWFNPDYVRDCTDAELVGALAHITMHIAHGHPWRGAGREQDVWNESCDEAINPLLEMNRFQLPDDHTSQDRFKGKSAEAVYMVLLEEKMEQPPADSNSGGNGGQGAGQDSGGQALGGQNGAGQQGQQGNGQGGCGQVVVPQVSKDQLSKLEADWTLAVEQAYQYSAGRGLLPNGAETLVKNLKQAKIDWRAELRRFMQQTAKTDYSWVRPNPRYTSLGLYLPTLSSEQTGEIVLALDTSGSTYNMLEEFMAELGEILLEVQPERVHVLHIDAALHHVDVFERGDTLNAEFKLHGGGGTRFEPAFEYAAALEQAPACMIYLTDLDGSFPDDPPEYPVLWAATAQRDVPFGEILHGLGV